MTPHCLHPPLNSAGLNTDAKSVIACSIDSYFNDLVCMMQCSSAVDWVHKEVGQHALSLRWRQHALAGRIGLCSGCLNEGDFYCIKLLHCLLLLNNDHFLPESIQGKFCIIEPSAHTVHLHTHTLLLCLIGKVSNSDTERMPHWDVDATVTIRVSYPSRDILML